MLLATLHSNPDALFIEYAAYLDTHPDRIKWCHGILHRIGHEAVEELGWEKTMTIAKPLCGGGFIHGSIEARFGLMSVLSPSSVQSEIFAACGTPANELCYHGIGHGLMVLYKNDERASLGACKKTELPGRMDCYDGIFMHIFDAEETGVPKENPRREEGAAFCQSVTDEQKISCYFYLPRLFANSITMVENAVEICNTIETVWQQKICVQGAGHMFLKYLLPDRAAAMNACTSFTKSMHETCFEGAKMYSILQENTGL